MPLRSRLCRSTQKRRGAWNYMASHDAPLALNTQGCFRNLAWAQVRKVLLSKTGQGHLPLQSKLCRSTHKHRGGTGRCWTPSSQPRKPSWKQPTQVQTCVHMLHPNCTVSEIGSLPPPCVQSFRRLLESLCEDSRRDCMEICDLSAMYDSNCLQCSDQGVWLSFQASQTTHVSLLSCAQPAAEQDCCAVEGTLLDRS